MSDFKAGDKVYHPPYSNKVLTIRERDSSVYPIMAGALDFTRDGKSSRDDVLPSIYHATPENHAKLEDFYGVEFEAPPVKPTSSEIVDAKLDKSTEPVPCWVSNDTNCTQPTREDAWAFICQVCDYGRVSKHTYLDSTGRYWMHATPFNPHTREAITELPEGDRL